MSTCESPIGLHGRGEPGLSVFFLIDSLAPGGAERSLVDIAPALVSRGVQLEVATLKRRAGFEEELESAGVPVRSLSSSGRPSWLRELVPILRSRRPQLIHTTLFDSDIVGRTAGALTGTPVVSTIASTPYGSDHAREQGVRHAKLRAAQAADAASARLVRRFHAVSAAAADSASCRLLIRRSKIDVIPRGRDTRRLGKPSVERRNRVRIALGLDALAPVLLVAARHEPQKGLDVLLRALPGILAEQPRTVLLIAGPEGRSTQSLHRAVESSGLYEQVRILGFRDDVADLMVAADLFILPSRREGLPGAVLEAMALCLPIVASDLPTVREAVPDDRYALLVPPDDVSSLVSAVTTAMRRPDLMRERARQAQERFAATFEIESVAQSMRQFYERSLER